MASCAPVFAVAIARPCAGLAGGVAPLADPAGLVLRLAAVGHADALLHRERVPLVAPGARLRPLALGARVRAVPALSPGVRIGPLGMTRFSSLTHEL